RPSGGAEGGWARAPARGQRAPPLERATADRDPHRCVTGREPVVAGPRQMFHVEQLADAALELREVRDRDLEDRRAFPKSGHVVGPLDEDAAPRSKRLEQPVAQLDTAIRDKEGRVIRRLQPSVDPDVLRPGVEVGHPAAADVPGRSVVPAISWAPIAPSGPRAFATVSSHSASASLRQVIPPPTWRVSRWP